MSDSPLPTPPAAATTLFTLDTAVDYLIAMVQALALDRDILIANQNTQIEALGDIRATQQDQASELTNATAQINGNIATSTEGLAGQLANLKDAVSTLARNTALQIDALNEDVTNLITLWKVLIDGLGGVATSAKQDEEIALVTSIVEYVQPKHPASIEIDFSNVATVEQPVPTKPGP